MYAAQSLLAEAACVPCLFSIPWIRGICPEDFGKGSPWVTRAKICDDVARHVVIKRGHVRATVDVDFADFDWLGPWIGLAGRATQCQVVMTGLWPSIPACTCVRLPPGSRLKWLWLPLFPEVF